jgi:hypothetical protein
MKTGQYAGHEFNAVHCSARATPDSEPDTSKYGDGIYITELGLRVPHEHLPYVSSAPGTIYDLPYGMTPSAKHCGDTLHYEDLVVAFDKYEHEIFVGDSIYASVNKEVRRLTVVKMGKVNHVGCGWMQRKMRCTDDDTGVTLTINIPKHTIKIC